MLPDLRHYNQSAYAQGRSICDAIRAIDDKVQYTKQIDTSGVLISTIDFEKAFDSLNHKYLFKVLHAFNFGSYFVQWIRTFYSNVSSSVMNNDFIPNYFKVNRGGKTR